jgi:hypothetical protein
MVFAVLRRPNRNDVEAFRVKPLGESSSPPASCAMILANEKERLCKSS